MVLFNKSFFFLFIILSNLAYSTKIFPDARDIIINEGDSLTIKCVGSKKMIFFHPAEWSTMDTTSPAEIKKEHTEEGYTVTLNRRSTVFGDTGYYGCFISDIEKMTYVYVQSNRSWFVNKEGIYAVEGELNQSVILNCRPTSPIYTVMLYDSYNKEISSKDNIKFDPKEGFEIKNLSLRDAGYYRCFIRMDDKEQVVYYYIYVLRFLNYFPQPKIMGSSLQHVVQGQDMFLNCTIIINVDNIGHSLRFNTPHQHHTSRVFQYFYRKPKPHNKEALTLILAIQNITDEDEGQYECIVKRLSETRATKVNITILDS